VSDWHTTKYPGPFPVLEIASMCEKNECVCLCLCLVAYELMEVIAEMVDMQRKRKM
jgi:hypothetical protein